MRRPLRALALSVLILLIGIGAQIPQRVLALRAPGRPPTIPPTTQPAPPFQVRVLTFNVLCSFCTKEHYDPWPQRVGRIQAVIDGSGAELVALQELFTADQVALLAGDRYGAVTALPNYADSAILYRRDRWTVRDSGALWMSKTPTRPLSWGWQPLTFPRYAAWALLEGDDHRRVVFVSTHQDSDPANHVPARRLLQGFIEPLAKTLPVIVAGDFNQTIDEVGFTNLQEAGEIAETKDTIGRVAGAAHTRRGLLPEHRIDHVWVGGPQGARVSHWRHDARVYGAENRRPSDHPAIVAEIRFP